MRHTMVMPWAQGFLSHKEESILQENKEFVQVLIHFPFNIAT